MKKSAAFMILALLFVFVGCNNYGDRVSRGKSEVFYTDGASKEEAEKLLDYLFNIGYFDEDSHKSVQIQKPNDVYKVNLVIKDEFINDESMESAFRELRESLMTKVFKTEKLELHLCDDQLKSKKAFK